MSHKRIFAVLSVLVVFVAVAGFATLAYGQESEPVVEQFTGNVDLNDIIQYSGLCGWVIIALSVVGLALVIENGVSIRRDKFAPPEVIDEMEALFEEGNYKEGLELCEAESNVFTRIVGAGIAKIGHGYDVIEKSLEEAVGEETTKLQMKLGWLSLIASTATMWGLLGTIMGMIQAFKIIAHRKGAADPADLAAGISQALVTTFEGLVVAIPITCAFFYFRSKVTKTVLETTAIVEDLFERFRPQQQS